MALGDNLPRGIDRLHVLETKDTATEAWGAIGTPVGSGACRCWMGVAFLSPQLAAEHLAVLQGERPAYEYRAAEYTRAESQDEATELAHVLAEQFARQAVFCECPRVDGTDVQRFGVEQFLDTSLAECDLSQDLRYLDLRGLLERHPDEPHWIRVREEGEVPA